MEYQSEHNIAAVLETLEELGVRDSTAVVVTADHGESWGERFDDKSEVRGVYHMHGAGLWDEVLQVPLILAAPELDPAVVPWQVRTVDIAPTLLDMAGMRRSRQSRTASRSCRSSRGAKPATAPRWPSRAISAT